MAIIQEKLDRGLWTAEPIAGMPEGALRVAKNCRYRIGGSGVYQAEGRDVLGPGYQAGLLAPSARVLLNVAWDKGSFYKPGKEQLSQLIYEYQNGRLLAIPLVDDVTSELYNPINNIGTEELKFRDNSTFRDVLNAGHVEAVEFDNQWYLFIKGKPTYALRRSVDPVTINSVDTNQFVRRVGLPQFGDFDGVSTPLLDVDTGAGTAFPKGFHFYWFTWWDNDEKIESGNIAGIFDTVASNAEADGSTIPSFQHKRAVAWYNNTAANTDTINIYIHADAILNPPPNATHLRVYKSPGLELTRSDNGATTPLGGGWPFGFRIAEVAISTLQALTPTQYTFREYRDDDTFDIIHAADFYLVSSTGYQDSPSNEHLATLPKYSFLPLNIGSNLTFYSDVNGNHPNSSCGDIFDDSLVRNDSNNRNRLWFSIPGKPDQQPTLFYIDLPISSIDQITQVKTIGSSLYVGANNSSWRVDYLPTSPSSFFQRGRVFDVVDQTKGPVWEGAFARFDLGSFGPMAAFVHKSGIYATDLSQSFALTNHVAWRDMVPEPAALEGNCWLINNAQEQRLEFYHNSKIWFLQYDAAHLARRGTDLIPAITGPIERKTETRTPVYCKTESGRNQVVSWGDVHLCFEHTGYTDQTTAPDLGVNDTHPNEKGLSLHPELESRLVFPNGLGQEVKLHKMSILTQTEDNGVWFISPVVLDEEGKAIREIDKVEVTGISVRHISVHQNTDGVGMRAAGTAGGNPPLGISMMSLSYSTLGESEQVT